MFLSTNFDFFELVTKISEPSLSRKKSTILLLHRQMKVFFKLQFGNFKYYTRTTLSQDVQTRSSV